MPGRAPLVQGAWTSRSRRPTVLPVTGLRLHASCLSGDDAASALRDDRSRRRDRLLRGPEVPGRRTDLGPRDGRRERAPNPHDIDLPAGYRIEVVADKLTFPTGVAFGDRGEIFVVESGYSYGEKLTRARVLQIEPGREPRELVTGDRGPWNGISYHEGALFVAHGGAVGGGGRIVRYPLAKGTVGEPTVLVDNLPSGGDHHTNGPVVSRDGWIYFAQGTVTNSGVVGPDNYDYGWLKRQPELHDVPCSDIELAGVNIESDNPLTPDDDRVTTGAYQPFGVATRPGQIVKGQVPCSGAVMRVRATGGSPELVAWGFRNPFGLALDGSDALYVTDNGYDTRGSRPVFGAADMLWKVEAGRWYGWPDYSEGRSLTSAFYAESGGDPKAAVLALPPGKPPEPAVYFASHSSATGLDFSRSAEFGRVGSGFVALFGDMAPEVGKVLHPVGFAVVEVDPRTGKIEYFARNRGDNAGPASRRNNRGLERPVAARFDRDGRSLYVVDFGILRMTDEGAQPVEGTGRLWRITRGELYAPR